MELGPAGPSPRSFTGLVSIKDYPGQTAPGMLDELLRLPFELTVSQSFGFVDRQAALVADEPRAAPDALGRGRGGQPARRAVQRQGRGRRRPRRLRRASHDDRAARRHARRGRRGRRRGAGGARRSRHHRGARGDRAGARLLGAVPGQLQIYRPARPGLDRAISPGLRVGPQLPARPGRHATIGARRSRCWRPPPPALIISTSTRAISAISPSSARRARARRWC